MKIQTYFESYYGQQDIFKICCLLISSYAVFEENVEIVLSNETPNIFRIFYVYGQQDIFEFCCLLRSNYYVVLKRKHQSFCRMKLQTYFESFMYMVSKTFLNFVLSFEKQLLCSFEEKTSIFL